MARAPQAAPKKLSASHDDAADVALQPSALSGGLSRGLCLINKAVTSARAGGKRSAQPRMLCLQGSPDATQQYIAVMNSIFAAQVGMLRPSLQSVRYHHNVRQCLKALTVC